MQVKHTMMEKYLLRTCYGDSDRSVKGILKLRFSMAALRSKDSFYFLHESKQVSASTPYSKLEVFWLILPLNTGAGEQF